MKSVRAAWWIWALAPMVVVAVLLVVGCAGDRYLTKEQDDEMRAVCEQEGGCAVLPGKQWEMIEQLLRRMGLWRDT